MNNNSDYDDVDGDGDGIVMDIIALICITPIIKQQ